MDIKQITKNKENYLELLLLADEQESMIYRYLQRGNLFVINDPDLIAVCVVTDEGGGIFEIKNLAVNPKYQRKGYGRKMLEYITEYYREDATTLLVGTGESPLTILFYEACGFKVSHRVENFFTEQYDHPIFECGKRLIDMIYLKKEMRRKV